MPKGTAEIAFYMSGYACGQAARIDCDASRTSLGSGEPRGAENGPPPHHLTWVYTATKATTGLLWHT